MLKQVQELQKYLKDKKIPSSGAKKDLVHRVKMYQDSISRQRGGLGEGGMSWNRIVGGESCGAGAGEGGGSKQGGGEGEGEGEGEGRINGCRFMTKEERGEGMRTCRNLRTTTTTARRMRKEEGLPSSSEDDEDHLVQLLVRGKRTRTPNTRFFNDNFA
jgi:hypothetical protein